MSAMLVSKYANLHLIVRNTETALDPQRGRIVTAPGRVIKFNNHVALVEDEDLKIITESPSYIGATTEKVVWLESDDDCPTFGPRGRRNVVSGMNTGSVRKEVAPVEGWDKLTVKEIKDAVDSGQVSNISDAIAYESRKGGRRRSGVIKALSNALDAVEEGAKPKPARQRTTAEKDETFDAPAPSDSDKK